jgi:hypothetical protein
VFCRCWRSKKVRFHCCFVCVPCSLLAT